MPVTATAIAGGVQTVLGVVQAITAKKPKKLPLYKTPDEIFKILQSRQWKSQEGYDPVTLNYLTGQAERAFGSSINAATQLGADPNQLSDIQDQFAQNIFKIGAQNQLLNMQNYEKLQNAWGVVADNKAAEQKSLRDRIADENRLSAQQKQDALQNITGGVNTGLAALSSNKTMDLYKDQGDMIKQLQEQIKKLLG